MRTIAASGELAALVPERAWVETERALGEAQPVAYLEVLRACGALGAVLPEVAALFGVPQPTHWHPEVDTGEHTLQVLRDADASGVSPAVAADRLAERRIAGGGRTPWLPGDRPGTATP